MRIVGIDPGFGGGIALLQDDKIEQMYPMPIVEMSQKRVRKIRSDEKNESGKKTKTYIGKLKEYDYVGMRWIFAEKLRDIDKVYVE